MTAPPTVNSASHPLVPRCSLPRGEGLCRNELDKIRQTLDQSYAYCRDCARRSASNFYYCLYLLPRAKRDAMFVLYAFLRHVDDIGDEPVVSGHDRQTDRAQQLANLRQALLVFSEGDLSGSLTCPGTFDVESPAARIFPALRDVIEQYHIPLEYLVATIDGVEMDLRAATYQTFDDLKLYCERVASVVGQACIHIWGFKDPAAIELARQCGLAFQLTNILRDLKEDAARGRIYLPAEDLQRFGYSTHDLQNIVVNDSFQSLMQFQIARAESYYTAARPLSNYLFADGRRVFWAMFDTYHGLLEQIRTAPEQVFAKRVRISRWRKARIAIAALLPRIKT